MSEFTITPNSVLSDPRIIPSAKIVWIGLKSFCFNNSSCYPSYDALSKRTAIKRTQIFKNIKLLCECGLLKVESRPGRSTVYHLIGAEPIHSSEPVIERPIHSSERVESNPFTLANHTHSLERTTPIHSSEPEEYKEKNIKEEDKSVLTPIKKSRKKEKLPPLTKEELEEQLRKIEGNINLYIEAFPNKNVRETIDSLRDRVLLGDGVNPIPNPKGYRDLNLTLRNWLRNAKYVPTWVAAQANNTPAKLPDKLPEPKEHKPYRPSEDPELLESLTDIAEKRAAKMKAREAEDKKRKELIIKELEEEVRLKEREKKPEPVVEKVTPPSRAMTKEEIIAEMKRIANG